nr:TrpB-like pyridoxal phosphate-dependent enzyme [Vulcanisaeta thermophila]
MPHYWYNINVDLPKPLPPPIDPYEGDSRIALLMRIMPSELLDQEFTALRYVPIPEEVRELYARMGRPTPLREAVGLERALGNGVRIYYKFEGALPTGSHKLNTAIPQVYYAIRDGAKEVVTETGAGQWGLAVSLAAALLGVKATIFMTRNSYMNKKQRVLFMRVYGADVYPSPSEVTKYGIEALRSRPDHPGSLGLAITEAIEFTLMGEGRKYIPGSVLGFVVLHQTVIGQEVLQQLPEEPDLVVGCVGGGSNFSGFSFPMMGMKLRGEGFEKTRFLAVESTAAPKLTKGRYTYDFPDTGGLLPMIKMLTLGHDYVPPPTHAAGLRYHGAAPSLSLLIKEGYVETRAYEQEEVLRAARLFARTEGIIPAPESAHAIKAVIDEARRMPKGSVIVFNLSGHGLLDPDAYEHEVV